MLCGASVLSFPLSLSPLPFSPPSPPFLTPFLSPPLHPPPPPPPPPHHHHHSYVSAGLQAVLEFYFVHFLYVCSGTERATSLGTTSVNVYIAIYQLCAISAGILADKLIGNQGFIWEFSLGGKVVAYDARYTCFMQSTFFFKIAANLVYNSLTVSFFCQNV